MFAMRIKLGSERNKEWRCCFCLHVRTATIIFGIWHLMLHLLALTVLALVMRNHHITFQRHEDFQQNDFLPTPLSKIKDDDNPYYLPTTQDGRSIYSSDIDMGALMTVCTLSITLLMVYGTIKGKATHLLPFFCLQLFDFAITTLTATGYFCYLKSAHHLIAEYWNLPLRHELLQLNPQVLTLIVVTVFLCSMLWKSYWISVVWRCYKYLTLRHQSARNAVHYIIPEGDGRRGVGACDPADYLFDREAGLFGPSVSVIKQTPPPSYGDVMGEMPPPYDGAVTASDMDIERGDVAITNEQVQPESSNETQDIAANVIEISAQITPEVLNEIEAKDTKTTTTTETNDSAASVMKPTEEAAVENATITTNIPKI